MPNENNALTAIDLFSGGGGLSLGLKKAGFNVVAAVEINSKITKTYKANHKKTVVIERDIREVTGKEIMELVQCDKIILVAGCPPCQGFSSLTSKFDREDSRNDLILEMARIVEELNPVMVMMENVPGLANRGKYLLNQFVSRLEAKGYTTNCDVFQLADYEIPQMRRRLVLLAGRGFKIEFPKKTNCFKPNEKNKLKPRITLDRVIKDMEKPITFGKAMKNGGPKKFNWHVVGEMDEINKNRLRKLRAGNDRKFLPDEMRPICHSKGNKGFTNVYGRLRWKQVSPTITSGFTTLSMGRFGHPSQLRTISVREAALIQTFPINYKIDTTHITTAREIVGNAFPPKFGQKIAKRCINAYFKYYKDV